MTLRLRLGASSPRCPPWCRTAIRGALFRANSPPCRSRPASPFRLRPPLSPLLLLLLLILAPASRFPLPLPPALPRSAPLTAFARERQDLGMGGDYDAWDYGGGGVPGDGEGGGGGAQEWAEPGPGDHIEGVLDLDDVTVTKVVGGRWRVLVEFYNPEDQASKDALFLIHQASTLVADRKDCLLAKLDASAFPRVAARYNVKTLPQFVLFGVNDAVGTSFTGPMSPQSLANFLLHGHALSGPLEPLRKAARAFVDYRSDTSRRDKAHEEAQLLVEGLPTAAEESGQYYLKVMAAVIEKGEGFIAKEVARLKGLLSSSSLPPAKNSEFHRRVAILKEFEIKDEL